MKKAIIDIGSNTINLLIAEKEGNKLNKLYDAKLHAKLAKGGINDSRLTDEAIARGLDAMQSHKNTCNEFNVDPKQITAFATAAVRSASNGSIFVEKVKASTGISINTISGLQEAEMIFAGVKHGIPLDSSYVILDIGGGSCEFIIVQNNNITWKDSFPLGVSKLLDKFLIKDPLPDDQEKILRQYFSEVLAPLTEMMVRYNIKNLVGSSGSFDTIRNMLLAESKETRQESWMPIAKKDFVSLFNKLRHSTKAERNTMEGMDPARVDYMPVATVFVDHIITTYQIEAVYQCGYALKEGAFFYFND